MGDRTLKKKQHSNVTITMSDFAAFEFQMKQQECRDWIQRVIKEDIPEDLHAALSDGVVLCRLVNAMFPGVIKQYNKPSSYAFKLIENINMFLEVCKKMGLTDTELFLATDLYENKNMLRVVKTLHSVANAAAGKGFAVRWQSGGEYDLSKQSGVVTLASENTSVDNVWNALVTPEAKTMKVASADTDQITELLAKMEKLLLNSKENLTPLHLAAKDGIEKLVNYLVDQGVSATATTKSGTTPLHFAAQNGNEKNIQKLLTASPNAVNVADEDGNTALHLAVLQGSENNVRRLLEAGADINATNKDGYTPLHLAALNGKEAILKLLLEKGAKLESANKDGNTPLHLVAQQGSESNAVALLDGGANVNSQNKESSTPLHVASLAGHGDMVNLLLKRGGNVKVSNKDGNTALHYATLRGHKKVVDKLIDSGSDVNAKNNDKATALHVAADGNFLNIVQALAESGAEVDIKRGDGWTPLYSAAYNGNKDACVFLLSKGADVNAKNEEGWTPLHAAASQGHKRVVKLLITDYKAQINLQSKQGTTPLFHAASSGRKSLVEYLIKLGADKELSKERGWKPIHIACYNDHYRVARLLVENGVDLNCVNDEIKGYTPLHIVISTEKPSLELIELFLQKGADMNKKNSNGSTALHLAVFWNHLDVLQALIAAKANMTITNNKGRTALDLACHYGNAKMAKYLAQQMGIDESKLKIKNNKQKVLDMETPKGPPKPEEEEKRKK